MFRANRPEDEALIYSSWLKSLRDSPTMAGIPNTVYYKAVHEMIEKVLARATVLIACDESDPDTVFGYIVYEPGVIHWAYTKHTFRGAGIGTALENAALALQTQTPIAYTCRTRVGERLIQKRAYYTYNPFIFIQGAK